MTRRAFTLVELLVVIAIIGLLSTVAIVALGKSQVNARNAKRKADLRQLSKIMDLYYADHDHYPVTSGWRGSCSSYGSYPNSGGTTWIPDISPYYIAALPSDPTHGQNHSTWSFCDNSRACYLYYGTATDYKIMAFCTPEGAWNSTDPFYDPGYPTSGWSVHTPAGTC
jgi:prepilin-type N-terminal cleavage/methylation domain-containing protein